MVLDTGKTAKKPPNSLFSKKKKKGGGSVEVDFFSARHCNGFRAKCCKKNLKFWEKTPNLIYKGAARLPPPLPGSRGAAGGGWHCLQGWGDQGDRIGPPPPSHGAPTAARPPCPRGCGVMGGCKAGPFRYSSSPLPLHHLEPGAGFTYRALCLHALHSGTEQIFSLRGDCARCGWAMGRVNPFGWGHV